MAESCRARCRQRHARSIRIDGDKATDGTWCCWRGEGESRGSSMAFFYRCAANLGARPRFIEVHIMTEHGMVSMRKQQRRSRL